jgi:predicted molibdopterin-dependent oxidoreductase YjgC
MSESSEPSAPIEADESLTPITITVDGHATTSTPGRTLLDVLRELGVDTPTLCFGDTIAPRSVCRVCVVEVEGSRALVPSCSRVVEAGMAVHTDTDRVRAARRGVLELLASDVDMHCTAGFAERLAEYDADPAHFGPPTPVGNDARVDNDLYMRALDRCILCFQCVDACGEEWQNTFAIAATGRGGATRISTEHDGDLGDSACVFCGNCVEVCPTGALMPMREHTLRVAGEWAPNRQHATDTICPYCGVGCTLTLHVQDNTIVKVTSPHDNGVGHGNLCVKGRYGFEHVQVGRRPSAEIDSDHRTR